MDCLLWVGKKKDPYVVNIHLDCLRNAKSVKNVQDNSQSRALCNSSSVYIYKINHSVASASFQMSRFPNYENRANVIENLT